MSTPAEFTVAGWGTELTGRRAECEALDRLVAAVRAGGSRTLVVQGEPGAGKSALLGYLAGHALDCRVVRATGVRAEMEFAYAALHQLCAPMLDYLGRLPGPLRKALRTAFGMSAGSAPDRFLVGLAVLSLVSDVAEKEPLICLVDDQQWLDQESAQVLSFVARRLGQESVGLVFGTRVAGDDLTGLPELAVGGLREADARALLEAALAGPVDARVRDQIVAEARGNPLALLELPRSLTAAELAGGFGLPGAMPRTGGIEDSFRRRVAALPAGTRRLLVLAAADPTGDPGLVWQAAGRLGIGAAAAEPAAEAGLAEFGIRVRFRHPLVRSVAYRSAPVRDRRLAHGALAEVTDPRAEPDRRAWHRAQAAPGPDEGVAADLERSAGRARVRGGLAAAAAFGERAAMLTPDPARRAGRALAAVGAKIQAGALDAARDLLAMAEAGPLSEFERARAGLLRAQLAFTANHGTDAPVLLLTAARRLEPIDAGLSRATYLEALSAAMFAGRLASPAGELRAVAHAAGQALDSRHDLRAPDLLLAGLAKHFTDGYAESVAILREALTRFGRDMSADEELRSAWVACVAALHIWDDEGWHSLSDRFVQLARDTGSLSELPLALTMRAHVHLFAGELSVAASLIGELQAVAEATGSNFTPHSALFHAALRGDEDGTPALIEAAARDAALRGEGVGIAVIGWVEAVLGNGLGRYQEAMTAAQRASSYDGDIGVRNWALVELVEGAARSELADTAIHALDQLTEQADTTGTDWTRGIAARCRAMLSEGTAAERLYRESITRLGQTRMRPDLARAHLLYGEWLRRQRRRGEAREQLRIAHDMLAAMGMQAFAERAWRELRAAGGTARKRAGAIGEQQLTAQEARIARLARDGMSNPEIGARLFLSPRTVQYHLSNVFAKLGITSRSQLGLALPRELTVG